MGAIFGFSLDRFLQKIAVLALLRVIIILILIIDKIELN